MWREDASEKGQTEIAEKEAQKGFVYTGSHSDFFIRTGSGGRGLHSASDQSALPEEHAFAFGV